MKAGDSVRLLPAATRIAYKGASSAGTAGTTTAVIIRLLSGGKGGAVLDRPLNGFRCWRILDLEATRETKFRSPPG